MQIINITTQTHIPSDRSTIRKRYVRGEQISYLKLAIVFPCAFFFCRSRLPMPRERYRTSFHQVSEFDRGRIVAYRVTDYPSEKSIKLLDEMKQLSCESVFTG
ncbi:hypothetical protein TNCV_2775251 [Trichonephila clavipes]|nr:hypothetical protein TNCV_2775251 [Trichonephila clavipes]